MTHGAGVGSRKAAPGGCGHGGAGATGDDGKMGTQQVLLAGAAVSAGISSF